MKMMHKATHRLCCKSREHWSAKPVCWHTWNWAWIQSTWIKHAGQTSERTHWEHWEQLVGQAGSALPFISTEKTSQWELSQGSVLERSNTVTCATPSPEPVEAPVPSPPHCHRNLRLKDEAGAEFQAAAPILFVPPWCCALTTCDAKGKEKDLLAEQSPDLRLQSCMGKGEARGRLEEKKSSNWVTPNWLDGDKLWMKEAVSCPTKLYCTKCTPNIDHWPQSLYLELWLWIISLQNSPLKMQHVPQTAAAETIFQRRIYKNFSPLRQKNLYGRWKNTPKIAVFTLLGISLHWKHLNYITEGRKAPL